MQGLKALVVVMGALIVVLATLIGWGLYKKSQDPNWGWFSTGTQEAAPAAPAAPPGAIPLTASPMTASTPRFSGTLPAFGEVSLPCDVAEVVPAGRLAYLRTATPGCPSLYVFDVEAGKLLGHFATRP